MVGLSKLLKTGQLLSLIPRPRLQVDTFEQHLHTCLLHKVTQHIETG